MTGFGRCGRMWCRLCLQEMLNSLPAKIAVDALAGVITWFRCPLSSAGLSSVAAISESREHQRGGDWEGPPNSGLGQHREF